MADDLNAFLTLDSTCPGLYFGGLRSNLPVLTLVDNPVIRLGGGKSPEGLSPSRVRNILRIRPEHDIASCTGSTHTTSASLPPFSKKGLMVTLDRRMEARLGVGLIPPYVKWICKGIGRSGHLGQVLAGQGLGVEAHPTHPFFPLRFGYTRNVFVARIG